METDTNLFPEDVELRMFFLSISLISAQALDIGTVKFHIKMKDQKLSVAHQLAICITSIDLTLKRHHLSLRTGGILL